MKSEAKLKFFEWLKLKEDATTSADAAIFARPIGFLNKNKSVKKAKQKR